MGLTLLCIFDSPCPSGRWELERRGVNLFFIHSVRYAVTGGWCWFVVREKYCWLAGGCWLVLVWCERKILLTGCSKQSEYYQVIGLLPDISYCLLSQCLLPNNRGAFIAYLLLFLPYCRCPKHMLRTRKKIERTIISETEEILLNKMLASSRKRNWGNNRRNNTMDTTAFLLATVLQ